MEEQNNQYFENQEPKEEIKETKSDVKKTLPKKVIIIGAVAVVLILLVIVIVIIESHDHKFGDYEVVEEPTCVYTGWATARCKCGVYDEKKLGTIDHSLTEWEISKEASCTTNGIKTRKCTGYQCTYIETEKIPNSGHNWADATCQNPKTCLNCGEKEKLGAKKPHSLSNGSCEYCKEKLLLNIIMPSTPVKSENVGTYKGEVVVEKYNVTEITYKLLSWRNNGTCEIEVSISGEKTYENGPQYVFMEVPIYIIDSTGNVNIESIYVGILHTGDTFENETTRIVLDADETYRITIESPFKKSTY